jgi:hypothetical protein
MQVHQSPAWTTPILAFCLSLILGVVLLPSLGLVHYTQYDFWLLCFVSMLLLALPCLILEIALAKRAKTTPLAAFVQLTREADRSTQWRLLSWLALLFSPFLAGAILAFATQQLGAQLGVAGPSSLWLMLGIIVAVLMSMLPRLLLLLVSLLASLTLVGLSLAQGLDHSWSWTPIDLVEWAKVIIISLVIGGLGLGLHWQNALDLAKIQQKTMSIVLPIWLAQVLGVGVLSVLGSLNTAPQALAFAMAALGLASVLLQFARQQLQQRQIQVLLRGVVLFVPVLLWLIPLQGFSLKPLIVVFGLLLTLAYAIFVGWLMKISHLRKAINFSHEALYNLWRVMIRIVLPLAVIWALLAWFATGWGA